jgi:stage 0 sporulation regulatory protein
MYLYKDAPGFNILSKTCAIKIIWVWGKGKMKVQTMSKENVTLKKINSKKREMYKKAKQFGLTHPLVVACSQELDVLLNQYQGIHQYDHVV